MTDPPGEDQRPVDEEVARPAPSDPMSSLDSALAARAAAEGAPEVSPEQLSILRRLRQPRTIASILVPILIIAAFAYLNRDAVGKVPGLIGQANPALVLIAFVIFYAGFPLRGLRWSMLLRSTGFRIGTRDATEIIFLSWLVNCVVPAKLGDVYRAYLLKLNSDASLSRTFGTVFIERILDLFVIASLGIAAGYWSFRNGLPAPIQVVFVIGAIVVVVLAVGLFTMRNFGRRILVRLPIPHRFVELYDRFEEGVFGAIGLRQLPLLGVITVAIWATESMRLYFVVRALAFPGVDLGLSGAVFVALIGSLLTAVPLSPAGLGIVEAGVIGVLHTAYGVSIAEASAIALLDRLISVFSVIVLGSIAYVASPKPRGEGRIVEQPPKVAPTRA